MRIFAFAVFLSVVSPLRADFVPFVIPAETPRDSLLRQPYAPVTPDAPYLTVRGSHFYDGEKRYRVWGVNVCFAANIPEAKLAPVIAERLAAAGVNGVRLHHLDTSRWPRGIWNAKDGRTIEPRALARLDRFVHELAQRGVRVNLNLHVGKEHSRDLDLPKGPDNYDKIVGIFTPKLIDAQKEYARRMLGHVNPHRGKRYADDPAVAFVEITNENSLFMWGAENKLRNLDPYYAGILQAKYNAWLKERYSTTKRLHDAWSKGTQPLGENMLTNARLDRIGANGRPEGWSLEQHGTSRAALKRTKHAGEDCLELAVVSDDGTNWHLQFNQRGLQVEAGKFYTVTMRVAAGGPRALACSVGQAGKPWGNLGLSRNVKLSHEWQTLSLGFTAKASESNARVSLSFGNAREPLYIANLQLHPGGQFGLGKGEKLENGHVRLFGKQENDDRERDRLNFLADAEKEYFDGMRDYVKNDLGCKALVTGTIVFGPLGLYAQSDMDFIDAHGYWQHPHFPGRPWDGNNWIVRQKAMVGNSGDATIVKIEAERMAGKPFTVSEYNHPAPNDYQVECVPMMASFAAAQDWDGVWLFAYSHTDRHDTTYFGGFFDMLGNPAKWGFMQAGVSLFRNMNTSPPPLPQASTWQFGGVGELVETHRKHDRHWLRAVRAWDQRIIDNLFARRFGIALPGNRNLTTRSSTTAIDWHVTKATKHYVFESSRSFVYVGDSKLTEHCTDGRLRLSSPAYCAVASTPMDGDGNRYLVTACGRCENTDMGFENNRQTVRRNWGKAPVRIETVTGELRLPAGRWKAHTIGPDGARRGEAEVRVRDGVPCLVLDGKHATMWYVVGRD